MPRGKARNYPPVEIEKALAVARAIVDEASSQNVSKLTLAGLLSTTPTSTSSTFRDLVSASRSYGLTTGGINGDTFGVTSRGEAAVGGDEVARDTALKQAVQAIDPYKKFIDAYATKKVRVAAPLKEFMIREAGVEAERADEAIQLLLADLAAAGFLLDMKGGKWVDVNASAAPATPTHTVVQSESDEDEDEIDNGAIDVPGFDTPASDPVGPENRLADRVRGDGVPKKVFIAHGKNRVPLEQLKRALGVFPRELVNA